MSSFDEEFRQLARRAEEKKAAEADERRDQADREREFLSDFDDRVRKIILPVFRRAENAFAGSQIGTDVDYDEGRVALRAGPRRERIRRGLSGYLDDDAPYPYSLTYRADAARQRISVDGARSTAVLALADVTEEGVENDVRTFMQRVVGT